MKRFYVAVLAILIALFFHAGCAEKLRLTDSTEMSGRFAANPRPITGIGDPFVLSDSGHYHVFATGAQIGFFHWSSDDLISFERDKALKRSSWIYGDYWAPEVYAWGDQYVMLYTGRWKQNRSLRIGIAFADAPEGPYKDPLGTPLFDFGYAAIDGTLTVDDAGTPYLIYSRDCSENYVNGYHESHLYGVQLSEDLMSTVGDAVALTVPDASWETKSGEYRWNEGPAVLRHAGKYYLFYSANYYASKEYGVGVAVADAPLGPYVKQADNPVLRWLEDADGRVIVSGPGHNSFFTVGEELFTAYHTHTDPSAPNGDRQLCIDRAGFHTDGTAYISGPTLAPQLRPLAELGLVNLTASASCSNDPSQLLTDGDICSSAASDAYVWPGDFTQLNWDTPVTADMLMLWPARGTAVSGTVSLNGCDYPFTFSPSLPGEAFVLAFEPAEVLSLDIRLEKGNLGEVLLVGPAV